jgi:hypothetical protein
MQKIPRAYLRIIRARVAEAKKELQAASAGGASAGQDKAHEKEEQRSE